MSPWILVLMGILGIIASAAMNILIVGFYIGKYRSELDDCRDETRDLRKDVKGAREDIARIKGRINGHMWKSEAT